MWRECNIMKTRIVLSGKLIREIRETFERILGGIPH